MAKKWMRLLFQPNLPLGENGQRVTACAEHILISRNAAKEGMVLLKNEAKTLPFCKGTKLALFGKGTFDYVKGGGGSGDVTVAYTINLYEGFKSLKDHVYLEENLADFYRNYVQEQYKMGRIPGLVAEPDIPDELCVRARAFTDTAVISISRFSGEGWDRSVAGTKAPAVLQNTMAAKCGEIFEHGDFYLSNAETWLVQKVKRLFPKVVVVLNVGGMVDTEWFVADDQIQSVPSHSLNC